MQGNFLKEVLSALRPLAVDVLSVADSKKIDAEVSRLPWRGQHIDWKHLEHDVIDLSPAGEYSAESISQDRLRQFLVLQSKRIAMMFSAHEPPIAMAVHDFVGSWFDICNSLTFLPKIILVSTDELAAENPAIVEIDPMQFIKGHVGNRTVR